MSSIFKTLTSLFRKERLRDKIHSIVIYFSIRNMEVKYYLSIATLRQIHKRKHILVENDGKKNIFQSNMPYYSYILRGKMANLLSSFCPYPLPARTICNKMETLVHKKIHFCFLKLLPNKVCCIFSKGLDFFIFSYFSTMIR